MNLAFMRFLRFRCRRGSSRSHEVIRVEILSSGTLAPESGDLPDRHSWRYRGLETGTGQGLRGDAAAFKGRTAAPRGTARSLACLGLAFRSGSPTMIEVGYIARPLAATG